ncbi:retrovirus-related pol polyprotein from transposon TNT 1-94, partial [Tanacetum coccineum]
EYYPGCEVCGSVAHEPADCPKKHPNRLPKEVTQKDMDKSTVMESLSPGLLIIRDVYIIDMSSYNKEINTCSSPSVNWLWHKRLSHLNFKNINNLAKHNLVSGLPPLTFSKDKNCSACEKGKHHRASFKTKRSFSINKCLHLLHMDLFRPVKPQTISHNKYTLVIVDEYSSKGVGSDNGTEFKNHKLEELCDEKGISQNFSSPCTPEKNGVAERRNKTLIEAGRTMLNSAQLPKQFWREDVNTACYTQNRSIIVKRHGKTTYGVFRGRSLDISYFMCLGVLCIFTTIGTTWESLMKRLMMDSSLVTLQWPKHSGTKGDAINFNENRSFPDDEFLEPRSKVTQCHGNIEYFPYILAYENTTLTDSPILQDYVSPKEPPEFTITNDHPALNKLDQLESADNLEPAEIQDNVLNEPISDVQICPTISPLDEGIPHPPVSQDRWSREKHIELVNIIGEPLAGITTRSRNGKISEEVYVQQPPGFKSSEFPNYVCKLDKALYGLKQAPKAWYGTLSKFLIQHKFIRDTIDNTLFTYKTKSDVIIVQIYVDDIIFGSTSVTLSKQFAKLVTKKYEMSMMGELTYFLGFQIKQDFKGISICQEKYVKDLLKKYDLADSALVKCLMLPPNNLGPDESGVSVNETLYQANPKESHLVAVKRICRLWPGSEAEYVVVAVCCAQVLWIKSQLADYDVLYDKNYINDALTFVKPHTISVASFQKPLASEVALTSVQPVTQSKAPTDLKPKKKKKAHLLPNQSLHIRSGSIFQRHKSLRLGMLRKQWPPLTRYLRIGRGASTRPKRSGGGEGICLESMEDVTFDQFMDETDQKDKVAEKPENPFDTEFEIKIIKRFQPSQPDDDTQITFLDDEPYNQINLRDGDSDSGLRSMPDDDLVSLTGFETPDSADDDSKEGTGETLYASADMPAQSDLFGHRYEEMRILDNKIDQLESSITKKVTDDIHSSVPSIIVDSLKENLHGLLSEALKNTLPQLIKDSIK